MVAVEVVISVPFLEVLKDIGGVGLSLTPRCRFDRCILLIGHMRCGSTALSNILCSRSEISGYGESHVTYTHHRAPGNLALNQIRRSGWKVKAPYLFDKILHNRLDCDVPAEFFNSRAIFVVRGPDEAIASIIRLFRSIGSNEYATRADAASYYCERLARMRDLWSAFPPDRRVNIHYEQLVATPETELDRLSAFLDLSPKLSNAYPRGPRGLGRGAGDPINAHRFAGIVSGGVSSVASPGDEQTRGPEMIRARKAYAEFRAITQPANGLEQFRSGLNQTAELGNCVNSTG